MKILAAMITALSVFVAGCAAATGTKPSTAASEARKVPLAEGASPSFDANDKHEDLKPGKEPIRAADKWSGHLEAYVESFPPEKRDVILDGISRYYTRYDQMGGVIRFEPVRYLSGPYARTSYIGLIGTLQPGEANAWAEIHYYNDVWVFANSLKVITDGGAYQSSELKFIRDNYGGKVWETAFLDLSKKKNRDLIERIVFSKEAIIRIQGDKYYADFPVTARMREDMEAMLKVVDAINASIEVQASL